MDFTIKEYKKLVIAFKRAGYQFKAMEDFIVAPGGDKVIVLRHDVDEKPHNALKTAIVENELGIKATYYFRIVKISNHPNVIKQIVDLGHEIGYHYEDLAVAEGDVEKAIASFSKNLDYFRTYYPVKTVCMHGSSMSDYDNRDLWTHYSLKDFDLIGEPYLSVDYSKVFYITDTGLCWDGSKYNVRDFVKSDFSITYHRSEDIISAVDKGEFPFVAIVQSHTLWTDSILEWTKIHSREYLRIRIKMIFVKVPFLKSMMYKIIQKVSN